MEKQICDELANGHYMKVSTKPAIISALGAVPKKDTNKIRLIHDCSRPTGYSLNSCATTEKFSYQTIQDAVDLITPGSMLFKLDLACAYRSVRIHESNYTTTGLKWTFDGDKMATTMVDTRLPFGACKSPQIFNDLSQAVCHIMRTKHNCKIVSFLDDFLVVCENYDEAVQQMDILIKLLRRLGFAINYNKIEGPSTNITFLGVVLNTLSMTLELPATTRSNLLDSLCKFRSHNKVTKKAIQSILGKINWATQCIYGGRFFMRRLIDRMVTLRKPWHRSRVTTAMKADLDWWINYMNDFNGLVPMVDCRPAAPVCIDSCNIGAGAFYNGECLYTPWSAWQDAAPLHINMKEVLALEPAVVKWAPHWQNQKIFVHTDNQTAAAIINKAMTKDPVVMASLRRIFWMSAKFNFRLKAVYYPGIYNVVADTISRIHENGALLKLNNVLHSTMLF